MHPLFSRIVALGAYLLLWATVGNGLGLLLTLRYEVSPWPAAVVGVTPLAVFYGLACLAAWYVCRAFPLDRPGQFLGAVVAHVAAAAVTSAVWVGFGLWWLREVAAATFVPSSIDGVVAWFLAGALLFLLSSAVHYVVLAIEASARARRQALESAILAREAELRALRAQVNPHFLYNSLHSIAALAPARPAAAQHMAVGLGEFLRQSLRLGSLPVVTLEQEVSLARQYLAIEQVRYADRLAVSIDVCDDVTHAELPPLLLQPLVENAITHGVAGLLDGGTVGIVGRRAGQDCELVVHNAYDPDEPRRPGTGMGLANVRARLDAHFGRDGYMHTERVDGTFVVTLRWPLVRPTPFEEQST
jgi:hypothetical protein